MRNHEENVWEATWRADLKMLARIIGLEEVAATTRTTISSTKKKNKNKNKNKMENEDAMTINDRDSSGRTPLHIAATRGNKEVVLFLLEHGADPNLKDWESGWTPLHRSIYFSHLEVTLLLVRFGAFLGNEPNKTSKDFSGETFKQKKTTTSMGTCIRDREGNTPLDLITILLRERYRASNEKSVGGEVHSFGKGDFQLGYYRSSAHVRLVPTQVQFPTSRKIKYIASAKYHTLAVSTAGQVFSWGFGKDGRLGHGNQNNLTEPLLVSKFLRKHVSRVSAGENHSLALTNEGQVYSWGNNTFGQLGYATSLVQDDRCWSPKKIESLKKEFVVDIAASSAHSAIVSRAGNVYTMGRNKHGQLGRKDGLGTNKGFSIPWKVDILVGERRLAEPLVDDKYRVVQVSAASCHTCIVMRHCGEYQESVFFPGEIWQWGYGSWSPKRLYFGKKRSTEDLSRWRLGGEREDMIQVTCAKYHSLALSSNGLVYTWGVREEAGKLDDGSRTTNSGQTTSTPQIIRGLLTKGCAVDASISQNRFAVVMDTGDLYTWGSEEMDVDEGVATGEWQPIPKQVPTMKQAARVATGEVHTVVLTIPRRPMLPSPYGVDQANGCTSETFHGSSDDDLYDLSHGISKGGQSDVCLHENKQTVPSLFDISQYAASQIVDVKNACVLLAYADAFSAEALKAHCAEFIRMNLDAFLVQKRSEDLAILEELAYVVCPSNDCILDKTSFDDQIDVAGHRAKCMELQSFAETRKSIRTCKKRIRQIVKLRAEHVSEVIPTEARIKLERETDLRRELIQLRAHLQTLLPSLEGGHRALALQNANVPLEIISPFVEFTTQCLEDSSHIENVEPFNLAIGPVKDTKILPEAQRKEATKKAARAEPLRDRKTKWKKLSDYQEEIKANRVVHPINVKKWQTEPLQHAVVCQLRDIFRASDMDGKPPRTSSEKKGKRAKGKTLSLAEFAKFQATSSSTSRLWSIDQRVSQGLHEIQEEQGQAKAAVNPTAGTSSWGLCEAKKVSLSQIQEDQLLEEDVAAHAIRLNFVQKEGRGGTTRVSFLSHRHHEESTFPAPTSSTQKRQEQRPRQGRGEKALLTKPTPSPFTPNMLLPRRGNKKAFLGTQTA